MIPDLADTCIGTDAKCLDPGAVWNPSPMGSWKECRAVERGPAKVSGAWLFANARVPVRASFENPACWLFSPIHVRAKLFERQVSCDELHTLKLALGGQHPIKRITVGDSVAACLDRMGGIDRHEQESVGRYELGESIAGACCLIEFAETMFCGDLPCGGRTDGDGIRLVSNGRPGGTRQRWIIGHPPEKRVRVEQKSHPFRSQAANSSSGSGSKNSSVTRPRRRPG